MFLPSFSLTRKVQTMLSLKSFLAFSLLFPLLFTACDYKDEILSPEQQQKQLSKIVQDANNYTALYYNNGKLSKYENFFNSQLTTRIILNYEGQAKPQSENFVGSTGDYMKYYYYNSNSMLDSMSYSFKDSAGNYVPQGYIKYYYNGLGQLNKTEQYTNSNLLVVKFEYTYDSNGNLIEEKQFNSEQLVSDATMTYDDKVNPWYSLKDYLLYNVSINKNNALNRNQVFYDSQENYQNTITSYVYDSDGYPISSVIQYVSQNSNITITNTFEYN